MFKGLVHEQLLKARLKSGFSAGLVIWAALALVCAVATFVFALVAVYMWLAIQFGWVPAGLIMTGLFLAFTIISLLAMLLTRRSTMRRARAELTLATAARQHSVIGRFDPKMLAIGVQMLTMIGMRRFVPIAAIGFLAATLGKEWSRARRERTSNQD